MEGYGILTQVALGFIAFVIGNEFRLSALKHMGRRAVTVGVAQAVITTALVDIALVACTLPARTSSRWPLPSRWAPSPPLPPLPLP